VKHWVFVGTNKSVFFFLEIWNNWALLQVPFLLIFLYRNPEKNSEDC